MANVNENQEISEELRAHAVDLAARIRLLREEIREGRVEGGVELKTKAEELATLFPVDASAAHINFEIVDSMDTKGVNQLGMPSQTQCFRTIEVGNPNREADSFGIKTISLLPKYRSRENLVEGPDSKILPPAFGGI